MFILMVDLGTPSISLPQNFNGHRNLNLPLNESTSIGAELPLTKKMGSTYKIIKKTKSLFTLQVYYFVTIWAPYKLDIQKQIQTK